MAKVQDLETDVALTLLATKAVKARNQADRNNPEIRVEFKEGDFICSGWWEGRVFCIALAKQGASSGASGNQGNEQGGS